MNRNLAIPAAALLVAVALAPAALAAPGPVGRYIVVLRDGSDAPAIARDHAARFGAQVGFVYGAAIDGYAAAIPEARLAALTADPRVAFVSEDRVVSTTADDSLPTGIKRSLAPAASTASGLDYSGAAVSVAVIDTGIDRTHPDLNILAGKNCSSGSSWSDGNGHGTHVSGTIGAKDNGVGVVGVAPGIPLIAVRVLNNQGSGTWSSIICGIDWVTQNRVALKIRVANMSLGGSSSDSSCVTGNDAFHKAICNSTNAGILYVVAAGNSNTNLSGFVPATYDETLSVTAMADFNGVGGGGASPTCRSDVDDTSADFSNYASASSTDAGHTIAAPGVCILSTWKGGGYNTISGTSMASPHVAGAAALCIATSTSCAALAPLDLRAKLRSDAATASSSLAGFSGDPKAASGSRYYGYLLDAGY